MIAGATRGRGGGALARHFLQLGDGAQQVRVVDVRGLAAAATLDHGRPEEAVREGFRELAEISAHGLTDRWCHHVHVDPPPGDPDPRGTAARFLELYEQEFHLAGQARIVVEHEKGDRVHWHAAYSLIGENGRLVDGLSHHHRRTEKISRITEFERGLALTKGAHNRSVIAALRREGREDVAAELERAGLHRGGRARAPETPQERAQRERSGNPSPREIGEACLAAWRESGTAAELRSNLEKRGLELREGKKGPVVLDRAGATHSLSRRLGEASKRIEGARIRAREVRQRLAGERLQNAADGRQRLSEPRTGPEWVGDVQDAVWETKALRGGLASLRHALSVQAISMRWDVPRKVWLLSRDEDGPYGLLATAAESLQSGELRNMRRIDEARRGLARACIGRIEEGADPAAPIAELRRAGLEIEWHGPRSGWQVVGDDGARYGRAETICGREPGSLDQVLERACGREGAQQRGDPAPAREPSAAGRLARAAAAEGVGILAEALQGLLADGPPPDDHVADARAALSIAELSGNAKRIGDVRYRLGRAEQAHREALRRWDERQRRQAEARRKAREREHRGREERGR